MPDLGSDRAATTRGAAGALFASLDIDVGYTPVVGSFDHLFIWVHLGRHLALPGQRLKFRGV